MRFIEILGSKYIKLILIIITFIYYTVWSNTNTIQFISLYTIYGILLILLFLNENTHNATFAVLLQPFTVSNIYLKEEYSRLLVFIIPIICLIIGIIINYIIYRPKLKTGRFGIGILIYCIGLTFAGINSRSCYEYTTYIYKPYYFFIFLFSLGLVVGIIMYLSSTSKSNVEELANDSIYLTLLIIAQITFFLISNNYSISKTINEKLIHLGWGINNEVAITILSLMPFSIYKAFQNIKKNFYYLLLYIIQFLILILCVSKGAILVALSASLVLLLGLLLFVKNYKHIVVIIISLLVLITIDTIFIIMIQINDFAHHFTTDTLNSRYDIWKSAFNIFKENYLFGIGVLSPFEWQMGPGSTGYQFAHNTLIHSLVISGLFGTICLIYHLLEKYSRLIYKINYTKYIILMSFIFPALYGLIDNTYLFLNYMFVLAYEMISIEDEIKDEHIRYLLDFDYYNLNQYK